MEAAEAGFRGSARSRKAHLVAPLCLKSFTGVGRGGSEGRASQASGGVNLGKWGSAGSEAAMGTARPPRGEG